MGRLFFFLIFTFSLELFALSASGYGPIYWPVDIFAGSHLTLHPKRLDTPVL